MKFVRNLQNEHRRAAPFWKIISKRKFFCKFFKIFIPTFEVNWVQGLCICLLRVYPEAYEKFTESEDWTVVLPKNKLYNTIISIL